MCVRNPEDKGTEDKHADLIPLPRSPHADRHSEEAPFGAEHEIYKRAKQTRRRSRSPTRRSVSTSDRFLKKNVRRRVHYAALVRGQKVEHVGVPSASASFVSLFLSTNTSVDPRGPGHADTLFHLYIGDHPSSERSYVHIGVMGRMVEVSVKKHYSSSALMACQRADQLYSGTAGASSAFVLKK